ncbi:MAG: outer membrane beta-barrel protein [Desulfobacterales bacterium]|nr:outer membrane beta-barrel protein [Desulfobacterales bacterium]
MKKLMGLVVLLVILVTTPALAEGEKKDTKWFLGAGYIDSEFDTGVSSLTGTASLDDEDSGFKVFGGYQLNPYVGFELSYADFGTSTLKGNTGDTFVLNGTAYEFTRDNANVEVDTWAATLGAVFSAPLDKITGKDYLKWVTPFAKVGGFYWDAEAEATANGVDRSTDSDDGFDFYYGGGLQINLHRHFAISGEWIKYNADDDIDTLSANVIVRF